MDTREHILQTASTLAQQRGFNAFSYADIADAVGIRKASIHHHFPSKDDLEFALVERYRSQFAQALGRVDAGRKPPKERLKCFFALYRTTLREGKLCLCGMMASDIMALPESVQGPLKGFFDDQLKWLRDVLEDGSRKSDFDFKGAPETRAKTILASLQGGLVVARAIRSPAYFDALTDDLLSSLG
jgi:TetR/AcrR family transcriptional regulator, transcriptional repressor for nem operon